jgi:transposase
MTKPMKTKERFIELRASGYTLAQASKELGISYNTAVNWEKEIISHRRIEGHKPRGARGRVPHDLDEEDRVLRQATRVAGGTRSQ